MAATGGTVVVAPACWMPILSEELTTREPLATAKTAKNTAFLSTFEREDHFRGDALPRLGELGKLGKIRTARTNCVPHENAQTAKK